MRTIKERAIEIMREFKENRVTMNCLMRELEDVLNPLTTIQVQARMTGCNEIAVSFTEKYAEEELRFRIQEYGFEFKLETGNGYGSEYSSLANMVQMTGMIMMNGAVHEKVRDIFRRVYRVQASYNAILEDAERLVMDDSETVEQTAEN